MKVRATGAAPIVRRIEETFARLHGAAFRVSKPS